MSPSRCTQAVTYALRGKAMVARVREFVDRTTVARDRLKQYRGLARDLCGEERPEEALHTLLAELDMHEEELSVAEEELQAQVEELNRLARALTRERAKYRELFEAAPEAYFVTDARGIVLEANALAAQLVGVEPRFVKRKPLAVMIDPDHVHHLRDALLGVAPGGSFTIEVPLGRRRGDPITVRLHAYASNDGERIRWLARDVSAERSRSFAGNLPQDELERRVADRTAALTRALRDSEDLLARERALREQLQASNDAKDRFLAVLSHDLRGPLNAVLGWTGLLRREHLDTSTRDKALATIERNALAQNELIEELLDVSRIGSGKMQLEMRLLDFGDLVRKGIDAVVPNARDGKISVVDQTGREPALVLGDAARLRRVVANLLANALKFTAAGGEVVVTLATNGTARLCVADTGKGIAPAVLPTVFDCFRQAGEPTVGRHGLGLGLYIVRHIVEMHGGVVKAESDGEGRGSRFTVTLPLRDGATNALVAESAESATVLSGVPAATLEGRRILLVDDEEDTRELLAAALTREGAEVVSAADAPAAVDAFDAFGPDVVVSDIGLPGMNGLELLRRLRGTSAGEDVAAIAVSAFASPDDARAALAAGFDAHVKKPFIVSALTAAIGSVLASKDG